jgi:hypothetical protein
MAYDLSHAGPCPWCGEQQSVLQFTGEAFQVKCQHCGARGPTAEAREGAAQAWDQRHDPVPAPRARVRK